MWLKKLKKKKFQFTLVALMLCFASTIFAACIGFIVETKNFTDNYVSWENCPRVVTIVDKECNVDELKECDELMAKTSEIKCCDVTRFNTSFYHNDEQISGGNSAYHISDTSDFIHEIKILSGSESIPKVDEIWISSVCADTFGIKVGDKLNFGSTDGREVTVSAIVVTLICPSPFFGAMPYYICDEAAQSLNGTLTTGVALYANEDISSVDYIKLIPPEFSSRSVFTMSSASIKMGISYLSDIFGGIGLLAALIVFIVSLIIIKFILNSSIAREYKEIGTYKALGFTESQILGFYLKCFIFSGSIGILLGALLSFPIAAYLCNMVIRNLGTYCISFTSIALAAGAVILLIAMLTIGVILTLKKVRKITPIDAFAGEGVSTKKKTSRSLIKNAHSPLSVAVNDIARKKRASILTICVLTISFYMTLLFSGVNYSLTRMNEQTSEWFAFPDYNALITITGSEEEDFVKNSEYVDYYILAHTDLGMVGAKTNTNVDTNEVSVAIYNDCSEKALGLPLLSGRHPQSNDEIIMSYNLSQQTGIGVGEWFHIENDTYSNDYLVSGVASCMYNGGLNIIINGDEFEKFDHTRNYRQIMVFLKDNSDEGYKQFENSIKEKLPDITITKTAPFLEGSTNSLNSISQPLTSLFVAIFATFSILNIINLLLMNNIENRKQYGILKAMGFTNSYICVKNILRILIMTTFSAATALLLHFFFSQRVFFAIIHVNGLSENVALTAVITSAIFIVILGITLLFTVPMRKVAPTELMEE